MKSLGATGVIQSFGQHLVAHVGVVSVMLPGAVLSMGKGQNGSLPWHTAG